VINTAGRLASTSTLRHHNASQRRQRPVRLALAPPACMKKILVVEYSQTGQLASVLDALLAPLQAEGSGVVVVREKLQPIPAYPFPWPFWQFMDTFPEAVAGESPSLAPLSVEATGDFDLVILGYPVWFLSPAPPLMGFLRSETGRRLLKGKPVVTVTACRNMWLNAQETMKQELRAASAHHCDHVALVDRGSAFATFITTPRWMMSGRKNAFWGLPAAGVAPEDIAGSRRFGLALREALKNGEEQRGGPLLHGLRACVVDERLIASEKVGRRSFSIWSRLLRALGRPGTPVRRAVLVFYLVFLVTLILTVVPLSMLIKAALRPLLRKKLAVSRAYFEQPSGSASSRLAQFNE
jgi:hypothetical protein